MIFFHHPAGNAILQQRQSIRQQIRQQRNKLSSLQQTQAAQRLTERLIEQTQVKHANNIAVYLANDGELSLTPFIHWCWQQHKQVFIPVLHPFANGCLLFLQYQEYSTMTANKYGILEPKLDVRSVCPISALDLLLTPLVAFDLHGARLGMGGGFYDRTLATWHQQRHAKFSNDQTELRVIGIAHDCQQVQRIATECWDIPLPEIITPTKSFSF
jgi:5-formyltetrahydrofolate cyclo-ligase